MGAFSWTNWIELMCNNHHTDRPARLLVLLTHTESNKNKHYYGQVVYIT